MKDNVENYVHMVKKEERMEKWQPTGPESVASRSIADGCEVKLSLLWKVLKTVNNYVRMYLRL